MNIVVRTRRLPLDSTAPTISAISATAGVGVSWTTNELADSQVEYGAGSATAYATAVEGDSPIAYWRLGESSGTSAAEEIGTATGTYVNTPTLGATSLISSDAANTAVTFAAASAEYVNVPSNMPAGSTAGFTVEMTVKPTADLAVGYYRMFSWAALGTTAHHLFVYRRFDDVTWGYNWHFSDGTARTITVGIGSDERIDDGSAHHVVAVHDYTGKTLKIYVDGVLTANCTKDLAAYGSPSAISSGAVARIGAYMGNTLSTFDGTIDDVSIYDAALSSTIVEAHYSAAVASGSTDYTTDLDPTLVTTHNVAIPSLAAGWTYRVKSRDMAGNLATSTDQTVGAVVSGTFQDIVDNASAGATVNLTGLTFAAGGTVDKALTIIGGTIQVPLNTKAITVAADNVTLRGMTILGSQTNNYDADETGIYVYSAVSGLTVEDCTVGNFGFAGMWLDSVTTLSVSGCTIYNCAYAGIGLLSTNGGTVEDNYIHHIGYGYTLGGTGYDNYNAYAVMFSAQRTITTMTRDVVLQNNVIEDVPMWHGIDSHGGMDLTISGNTIRRTSRPIFVTAHDDSGTNISSIRVAVTGNRVESPSPVTYNLRAIFFISSVDCSATANWISSVYPVTGDYPSNPADNRVDNYSGNTGLVVNSNILI